MRALLLAAFAGASLFAPAQVVSLRYAPHASCPDGLPGCWAGIHDTITEQPTLGVKLVPDFSCWMVDGYTKNHRLPDLEKLTKIIKNGGPFFSLRGIEVKLRGKLSHSGGRVFMTMPTHEKVELVQATVSHEVNPQTRVERPLTADEKAAFGKLAKLANRDALVTGWMVPRKGKELRKIAVTQLAG